MSWARHKEEVPMSARNRMMAFFIASPPSFRILFHVALWVDRHSLGLPPRDRPEPPCRVITVIRPKRWLERAAIRSAQSPHHPPAIQHPVAPTVRLRRVGLAHEQFVPIRNSVAI